MYIMIGTVTVRRAVPGCRLSDPHPGMIMRRPGGPEEGDGHGHAFEFANYNSMTNICRQRSRTLHTGCSVHVAVYSSTCRPGMTLTILSRTVTEQASTSDV